MFHLVLLLVLRFHSPVFNQLLGTCEGGQLPLYDLNLAYLFGVWDMGGHEQVYQMEYHITQPGILDSFVIQQLPQIKAVYVETSDFSGNMSCPSNVVWFSNPTSVDDPPAHGIEPLKFYDISGRLYTDLPKVPGVYFTKHGKVIILK